MSYPYSCKCIMIVMIKYDCWLIFWFGIRIWSNAFANAFAFAFKCFQKLSICICICIWVLMKHLHLHLNAFCRKGICTCICIWVRMKHLHLHLNAFVRIWTQPCNIDTNNQGKFSQEEFHGMAISVTNHLSWDNKGVERPTIELDPKDTSVPQLPDWYCGSYNWTLKQWLTCPMFSISHCSTIP